MSVITGLNVIIVDFVERLEDELGGQLVEFEWILRVRFELIEYVLGSHRLKGLLLIQAQAQA